MRAAVGKAHPRDAGMKRVDLGVVVCVNYRSCVDCKTGIRVGPAIAGADGNLPSEAVTFHALAVRIALSSALSDEHGLRSAIDHVLVAAGITREYLMQYSDDVRTFIGLVPRLRSWVRTQCGG